MAKKTVGKRDTTPSITLKEQTPASYLPVILFWSTVALMVVIPLLLSTAFYSPLVLPKFIALVFGAAILFLLLALLAGFDPNPLNHFGALKSGHLIWAALYLGTIALSTYFGVSPRTSFFGSYEKQMGLLTYVGFFICFVALVIAINRHQQRLEILLWAMLLTGTLTATYAVAQFIGKDPFLPISAYLFPSPTGDIVRVPGTLGHANYLGNFLLYITPLGASLAFVSRGSSRRLAIAATALSVVVIVLSGTRGAWLGLLLGALAFVLLESRKKKIALSTFDKRQMIGVAIGFLIVLAAISAITLRRGTESLSTRVRSFVADGMTGSGRTLLWRDAIKAIPAYAITGCGPEGFRKAFLAYKSTELARYAPQTNNESSHNSYLDASLSYGLAGAIVYIGFLVSAFRLLFGAYHRATKQRLRLLIAGIFSSLVAVCVHNFFIYDQLSTGLYFFVFMALALSISNITDEQENLVAKPGVEALAGAREEPIEMDATIPIRKTVKVSSLALSAQPLRRVGQLLGVVGIVAVGLAAWYGISAARTDMAIKQAFRAGSAKDLDGLMKNGEQATQGINPIKAYDYLFAQALSDYISSVPRQSIATAEATSLRLTAKPWSPETIETAMTHAKKSLADTLTPESNYVLLAYLAFYAGDHDSLRSFAEQAVHWDAKFSSTRLMLAEALLADGNQQGAISEAQEALRLNPSLAEARSVLTRARKGQPPSEGEIQDWLERGRKAEKKGKFEKARQFLHRAIKGSTTACPACHQLLATIYEKEGRFQEALEQWQTIARETPQEALALEAAAHIESLKPKVLLRK